MSLYQFSRVPKKVALVTTDHRLIKTSIPCEGTQEILESLDRYESRSMHGQIPILWDSAKDFNIFDIKGNKFIDLIWRQMRNIIGRTNP